MSGSSIFQSAHHWWPVKRTYTKPVIGVYRKIWRICSSAHVHVVLIFYGIARLLTQGSIATHRGHMELFTKLTVQITVEICWWKNFENCSHFAEVILHYRLYNTAKFILDAPRQLAVLNLQLSKGCATTNFSWGGSLQLLYCTRQFICKRILELVHIFHNKRNHEASCPPPPPQ